MAHINLLPWREQRRQERQQQFYAALVAGLIFAAIVLYFVVDFANGLIAEQNNRNTFLQTEISKLDKQIREIKDLEKERERLLARMQVIEELQASRPKAVKVLDSLVRDVPEGVHLSTFTRTGSALQFNGLAQSNNRVSVFMKQLDKDQEYGESKLDVIKKTSGRDSTIRSFTVKVNESTPKQEDGAN